MKKSLVALTAVAMLAIIIPFAFAQVLPPEPGWPTCREFPGRTPGYWKHQIKVYLTSTTEEVYTMGSYSWYFDDELGVGVKMNDGYMAAILDGAGVTALEALADLEAKGPGMNVVRDAMADLLNRAAFLDPYTIV